MQRYHLFNNRQPQTNNTGRERKTEERMKQSMEKLNDIVPRMHKAMLTPFERKKPQSSGRNVTQRGSKRYTYIDISRIVNICFFK